MRRKLTVLSAVGYLFALVSTVQPAAGAPVASFRALCASGWHLVSAPVPNNGGSIRSITTISANDVWAVGWSGGGPFNPTIPLAEHFNGSTWTPSSIDAASGGLLLAAGGSGPSDVWAVGYYLSTGAPLIVHFDGSSWSVITAPQASGQLESVAAISSSDVWAVGQSGVADHFDGTSWSSVPTASLGTRIGNFTSAIAFGSSDVWAAGSVAKNAMGAPERNLAERWNGTAWKSVKIPTLPSTGSNFLQGLAGIAGADLWAVGHYDTGVGEATFTLHRTGTTWSIVPTPTGSGPSYLYAARANASSDVWAVGSVTGAKRNIPIAEHWDGSGWTLESTASGAGNSRLVALATDGSGGLWSGGDGGTSTAVYLQHYCA